MQHRTGRCAETCRCRCRHAENHHFAPEKAFSARSAARLLRELAGRRQNEGDGAFALRELLLVLQEVDPAEWNPQRGTRRGEFS